MSVSAGLLRALAHVVHRHFLALLLAAYAAAALWPGPGLWLRAVDVGEVRVLGEPVRLALPLLLLAALLFSAGLGVRTDQLRGLLRRPLSLAAGLAANVLLPLALVALLSLALRFWHSSSEAQSLLVGLAVVAAMPVAGSSATWVQKADGDLPLSLGLVLGSTLLSPWTTPLALAVAGLLAEGSYAQTLNDLAGAGTGTFLAAGVVVPSLAGVLARAVLGERRVAPARPQLRLASAAVLLVLCYANAAVSLPQVVSDPDWDFFAMLLAAVATLCVLTFAAGWALARVLGATPGQRTALVYGLGMSNNGTGLVLAASALGAFPRILLPLIVYNLVQHLVAAGAALTMRAPAAGSAPAAAEPPGNRRSAA